MSVCGAKLFSKSSADASQHLILVVEKECQSDSSCLAEKGRITLYERLDNNYERVMVGFDYADTGSSPIMRRGLYEGGGYHDLQLLGQHARNKVEETAGAVISFILNVRVQIPSGSNHLDFVPHLGRASEPAVTEGLRLRDLLYRWPNQDLASSKLDTSVIDRKKLPAVYEYAGRTDLDAEMEMVSYPWSKISNVFPPVAEMLGHASIMRRCKCPDCANKVSVDECSPWCIRESAMQYFFLLVGHTVADAFGIDKRFRLD